MCRVQRRIPPLLLPSDIPGTAQSISQALPKLDPTPFAHLLELTPHNIHSTNALLACSQCRSLSSIYPVTCSQPLLTYKYVSEYKSSLPIPLLKTYKRSNDDGFRCRLLKRAIRSRNILLQRSCKIQCRYSQLFVRAQRCCYSKVGIGR